MENLLSCCLHDPAKESLIYKPRFTHRLSLVRAWDITPGQRLLDIGCGQGESCLVLAEVLGPSTHITGIDQADPNYGTPFALGESQQHIKNSTLGPRITFLNTDAPSLLRPLHGDGPPAYDAAVVCHSLWYFQTRESVLSLFHNLAAAKIPLLYLAEYSFQSSDASQQPHVIAAQALALLYAYKTPRDPGTELNPYNVRAALDELSILEAAQDAGFKVRRQGAITPEENMLEGHWDARHVQGELFRKRVKEEKLSVEQEGEILELAARVKEGMEELNKRGFPTVRGMDSWWAVLELNR